MKAVVILLPLPRIIILVSSSDSYSCSCKGWHEWEEGERGEVEECMWYSFVGGKEENTPYYYEEIITTFDAMPFIKSVAKLPMR